MSLDESYFQNQIRKGTDKITWQYGRLLASAGVERRPGLRVLDAGCGAAPGLRYLAGRGYHAFGTDLALYPLTVARQVVPEARLAQCDLAAPFPFAANSFDVVMLSEVIEHIAKTRPLLDECLRVLIAGGALVGTTPNLWDVRKYWQRAHWSGYVDPTHRRLFDPPTLGRELQASGFTRVRVRAGFKPMFWLSSRALKLRVGIPYPPLVGNTLLAVGFKAR
jgi:2-polyprenyl-3-methyl-5-hydroxy-6-metoxy-1,4-benzoquinol methylase